MRSPFRRRLPIGLDRREGGLGVIARGLPNLLSRRLLDFAGQQVMKMLFGNFALLLTVIGHQAGSDEGAHAKERVKTRAEIVHVSPIVFEEERPAARDEGDEKDAEDVLRHGVFPAIL